MWFIFIQMITREKYSKDKNYCEKKSEKVVVALSLSLGVLVIQVLEVTGFLEDYNLAEGSSMRSTKRLPLSPLEILMSSSR